MELLTRNFGTITIEEEKVITFKEGIPGFEELTRYMLIEDTEDTESPFIYLQSIENGQICFILIDPGFLIKDYSIEMKEGYLLALGEGEAEDFNMFVIVTAKNNFEESTVNLLAPIIIQHETRKGMQIILENTSYKTRHKIIDLIKERSS